MGKKISPSKKKAKSAKQLSAPDHLTMRLFTPGMSLLHRAGLGGLACTLRAIEREANAGRLPENRLPGGPWPDDQAPWAIDSQSITFRFGRPEKAAKYLERLFRYAFGLQDNLIFLPGQYAEKPPGLPVRAFLQQGMTLTFLQHGRVRKLSKDPYSTQYRPEGDDGPTVAIEFRKCSFYKHQNEWRNLVAKTGCLTLRPVEVAGPLNPGAVVRHNAFAGQTKIEEDAAHVIPLQFALVGCVALSINRGSGVLMVPEVNDLLEYCNIRPWFTPQTAGECQIAGASDAALQAQIRVRAKQIVQDNDLPGCYAVTFQPTPWATQQKSRVQTTYVPPGEEIRLNQFQTVMQIPQLKPKIVTRTVTKTEGKGKQKKKVDIEESFWVDSIVRPFIADNLARGQPWYKGFVNLMTKSDPVNNRPLREKLIFEKRGLKSMTETIAWQDEGEAAVVRAVHEAMKKRYGQIANETQSNPAARKNRWKGEYDRWRLAFAGAKTAEQFRRSLCDLFSRGGLNSVLQEHWQGVLPMLNSSRWQLTRDLALLGLASYTGSGAKDIDEAQPMPEID